MDTEFGELDANQQWEIGEPLRRALGSIPLEPGPSRSRALSETKPLAQEALATLTLLEQRRQLTAKELRQAGAIRRLLVALEEEEEAVYPGYQGRHASCSEALDLRSSAPQPASSSTALEPGANNSKAQDTAKENGASRVGPEKNKPEEKTRATPSPQNAGIGGR